MTQLFAVLGHGFEDLSALRKTVPKGCVLVLSEECGSLGTLPDHMYDAFQNPDFVHMFKHPIRYRKALSELLNKRIKIYTRGQSYPAIHYKLLNNSRSNSIEPSGVIALPAVDLYLDADSPTPYVISDVSDGDDVRFVFRGVWPRAETLPLTYGEMKSHPQLFRITQDQLFHKFPGIYYNFLCRDARPKPLAVTAFLETGDGPRSAYNLYPSVSRWINSRKNTTTKNRGELKVFVNSILARRNKSRSNSEKRDVEHLSDWQALIDALYSKFERPDAEWVRLVNAVPGEQLEYRSTHNYATALQIATLNQHVAAVRQLVLRGADINVTDSDGLTPILIATFRQNPDLMRALLASRYSSSAMNEHEHTTNVRKTKKIRKH